MTEDTAQSPPELIVETHGRVLVLTINRPERLNALSRSLSGALVEQFLQAGEDPDVWVIVVTAVGDRAFCAGMDLKELSERDADTSRRFRPPMSQPTRLLMEVISETYKPTIAAINGAAIGGGFELALACDIRIAAEGARFALPEAKIGMGAVYGSVVLPRLIPLGIALELMYTGDYLSAEDAARWGLVNAVHPPLELMEHTLALATRISENAPITIRRMKEMAIKGLPLPVLSALRLDVGPNPYLAEDRKIGIQAFLSKTKPEWTGR
jgi:enoyl-CoA hydratase